MFECEPEANQIPKHLSNQVHTKLIKRLLLSQYSFILSIKAPCNVLTSSEGQLLYHMGIYGAQPWSQTLDVQTKSKPNFCVSKPGAHTNNSVILTTFVISETRISYNYV